MSGMNVLSLLGGLGLFLFGMKVMGDGLERAAGGRLKHLLEMVTRNRLLAVLCGAAMTGLIQSSSATTVMVVGFVNAQLMSLGQAVGVIMGANIGTTVTSLMLSVKVDFGAVFACAGLVLSFLPAKWHTREAGNICMGLGVLFVGMEAMSSAMAPLRDWAGFRDAMTALNHPLLGVLLGLAVTAVLQSSSASIGILQALAGEGLIPLRMAMFVLYGQNIGTCVTSLIACAGTGAAAKRAAMVHLLFNVIGALLFVALTLMLPLADWIAELSPGNLRLQIALTHVLFNVITTSALLPLSQLLERAACALVPEKGETGESMRLKYFDERLLKTPSIACAQLFRETRRMGDIARMNYAAAMACFCAWDDGRAQEIRRNEEVLDFLNREITAALVEVGSLELSTRDAHQIGSFFHVVNDIERVGDLSVNVLETAQAKAEGHVKFSGKALGEIETLSGQVTAQLDEALLLFADQSDDATRLAQLEEGEQAVDDLVTALRDHHLDRLKNRKCSAQNGMLYLDMLTNLERVADHAMNIGASADKTATE